MIKHINKIFIYLSILLSSQLAAQQNTYTSVLNLKDTFDYAEYSFKFNNSVYLQRSRLPENIFISQLDNNGQSTKYHFFTPKLGYIKFGFHSLQIGSKLFQLGAEEDTIDRRGNILILNSDLTVFKDSVYFDYPNMEFDKCRYDKKRNKVIALYSYSIHKDSFNVRRWGVLELDTIGNHIRKKEITPVVTYEFPENFIVTSDGGYLIFSFRNGIPSFTKLDTNYSIVWRTDVSSTGMKYFTQGFSENILELPYNKGYVYVGEMKKGTHDNCNYNDSYTSLHFINPSGQVTKNYFHNITNLNCESSRPKGLFLKNDSVLLVFTQRDTTVRINRRADSSSSLVIHYNFNQHRVVKEIIGGQLLNGKTSWILPGFSGVCFRTHVGRDIDGGFLTSGWADIMDNNGTAAYLMKTDSCGYTQDHKCKLVYRIGQQINKSLSLSIDDSLSVLCQPIWTIENKKYTNPEIIHSFSTWGWHKVKLWGFAGSTTDSTEFDVYIDSTKTGIEPVTISYLNIYPNPASDILYIQTIDTKNIDYNITDLMGRVIKSDKYIDKIDISRLDNGVYFIELINDKKQRQVQKFVIKR